jgi:glycosyltransferase involved in cell wall biosynthesis
MESLKISVITPSFNQVAFIEENIRSVLAQEYANIEHIVVDGGSTDGTVEILKRYHHLRWVSEPDRGQTHALNKGFKMATGDVFGWVNSDDSYCPDILRGVAERFQNPATMVVCGDGYEIDERGAVTHPMSSGRVSPERLIQYWKWDYEFIQPAFFFRRTVFDEVGYLDESLYYAMDMEFFIRLGMRYTFDHVRRPLANLRFYSTTKSGRNADKIIPDYIWEFQKVSMRYWGGPASLSFYRNLFSFCGALVWSLLKNILFLPGSKSRGKFAAFNRRAG